MSTTAPERLESLRRYLEAHVQLYERMGVKETSAEALVLRHGRSWEWTEKPEELDYLEAKNCYGNSTVLAASTQRYTYVEGWAWDPELPIPMEHAWCIDEETGCVVDLTWRHRDDECGHCLGNGVQDVAIEFTEEGEESGWEERDCGPCRGTGENPDGRNWDRSQTVYLGIPVETDLLLKLLMRSGTYGLFYKQDLLEAVTAAVEVRS